MPWRTRSKPVASLAAIASIALASNACSKLRRATSNDASDGSAATVTISSAPSPSAAAPGIAEAAAAAASASAAAKAAARTAAVGRARQIVADIQWMVDKGVTMNRAKAGEGDVATKCDELESMRAPAERDGDPELVRVLDEGTALCAFDVPLLTASESLDHLRGTPSQASRLLMCNVAQREIAKARAVRPNDPRVRNLEGRRISVCSK